MPINSVWASDGDYEFTGSVQTLPNTPGFVGDWTIGGRTVHVTSSTELKQSDGQIAVGANVKVEGSLQNDGSINAEEIEVKSGSSSTETKFYGSIEALPDTAGRLGDWMVAGRTVHVNATTYIEQDDGPIAVGARVEVEGRQRADGSVDAHKIETEDESNSSGSIEFKGTIDSLPSTMGRIGEWSVSGRKVIVSAGTKIKQENGLIAIGAYVEVKGALQTGGSVAANEIETKSGPDSSSSNGVFSEFYGTIESLPGTTGQIGAWMVSGRKVNVIATTVIEHPERGIKIGARVEVKGAVQADSAINAVKIEIEDGEGSGNSGELYGKIETLPAATNLIGDWVIAGRTVHVTAATIIERKYGTVAVGAFVEVYGSTQADNSINATKIEVKQGPGGGAFMSFNPVATVSAASYKDDNSPESIVSAFGSNMASTTAIATTQPLPHNLADVIVMVDDKHARLFYVSPNQVNYQIPPNTPSGLANVTVMRGSQVVSQGTILVSNVALSLFTADSSGQGAPAGLLLRVKANGEQVYESLVRFDAAQNKLVPAAIIRRDGEQLYLILYGSGLRYAPDADGNSANGVAESVQVAIGGVNAQVIFAGAAPGYVGLEQINVRIPDNAPSNPSTLVTVKARDVLNNLKQANPVTISIQ